MSLFATLFESSIRHISGGFGRKLRYLYYRRRLGHCGKNVIIDEGVYFSNLKDIFIANDVWIDKNCILIAGPAISSKNSKFHKNSHYTKELGQIHIGHSSHIGINTILQGHAGIQIDEYFTSSAGCKLYSLSNDYKKCKYGTTGKEEIHYISSPIKIGKNVWLGLNVSVISTTINNDCFILSNSVVSDYLEANCVAKGAPAIKVKNRFNEE
ncbi:acyltransferase [Carboxylicivirga sp. N1Y90]|uniref:acyltransferase n=1 Tax=Carboxylicivirga fragile TaxID=3417571 RepID=UPI003D326AB7|nr:hypothetical protein [Marinilabiliaceae bacterium N1Y90]